MKRIQFLLVLIGIFCFVQNLSAQYIGGDNDGFAANIGCIQNLNGGSAFIAGPIIGSNQFCPSSTEAYSITVAGSTSTTVYNWTAPAGSTITSGQGTNSVVITFDVTPGNISVDASNECGTVNQVLPVTLASCTFFAGGNNDGFTNTIGCIQNLNGGSAFIAGLIVGSTQFCPSSTEAYSIIVAGSTSTTVYNWSAPAGSSITSGQGTNSVVITFGAIAGNISVDASNECGTVNQVLPVTLASCTFFAGGSNDGFTTNNGCIQNLNGGSAFIAGPILGSNQFCPSSTEAYSITVAGSTSTTVYNWTAPAGSTITSGQGTNSVVITFGAIAGNISVAVSNECETVNQILPVTLASCTFFAGGNNDGFTSNFGCIQNLNGGSAFIAGPIIGSTQFCPSSTEAYSITVAGSTSTTVYNWTVPAGSSITSGQGTNSIVITFGAIAGNISVNVSNECETVNQALPVTLASCTFFAGGNNDGFTTNVGCIQNLNGGSAFIAGPILGSTQFCPSSTEAYSITVAGSTSTTVYNWTVPAGSSITSGQGTNSIVITFGGTDGNISVDVSNACEIVNVSLAVSSISCIFYKGGSSDGFSVTTVGSIPLPIELISFEAKVESGIVRLSWATASELNNDFFEVEKSAEGEKFLPVARVEGSGTTSQGHKYFAIDESPFTGSSYYRLSQTDFDGTKSYSRVIRIEVDAVPEDALKLYPNPVRNGDVLHFDYFSEIEETIKISFVSPSGLNSYSKEFSVNRGENKLSFRPDFDAKGVYIIHVQSSKGDIAVRLIVL